MLKKVERKDVENKVEENSKDRKRKKRKKITNYKAYQSVVPIQFSAYGPDEGGAQKPFLVAICFYILILF